MQHFRDPEVSCWLINLELELIAFYSDPSCSSCFDGRRTVGWISFCWVIWLKLKSAGLFMSGYPEVSAHAATAAFLASSSPVWLHFVCRSESSRSGFACVGLCRNVGSELEGGEEMNSPTSSTTEPEKNQSYFQNMAESLHSHRYIQTK